MRMFELISNHLAFKISEKLFMISFWCTIHYRSMFLEILRIELVKLCWNKLYQGMCMIAKINNTKTSSNNTWIISFFHYNQTTVNIWVNIKNNLQNLICKMNICKKFSYCFNVQAMESLSANIP